MGEVYRARNTRLDRVVAVKVLPEHHSSNPRLRERFEREAKAISSLSHPYICPLYDVGQQNEIDYLVMEYLEGETMASRLKLERNAQREQNSRYATHKRLTQRTCSLVRRAQAGPIISPGQPARQTVTFTIHYRDCLLARPTYIAEPIR